MKPEVINVKAYELMSSGNVSAKVKALQAQEAAYVTPNSRGSSLEFGQPSRKLCTH